MEVILQEGQESRSKSEERASSSKTEREPTTQEGPRTTTRQGREEERRIPPLKVRKSVRIMKKESEQEPKQRVGENMCGKCSKKVANGVHCTVCHTWYHFICENTSQEEINKKYASEEDDYACSKHRVPQSNEIKGETDVHFKVWDQKPIAGAQNDKGGEIKDIAVIEKCIQGEKDQSLQHNKEGSIHHNSGDREVDNGNDTKENTSNRNPSQPEENQKGNESHQEEIKVDKDKDNHEKEVILDKCLLQPNEDNTSNESQQEEKKDKLNLHKEDKLGSSVLKPVKDEISRHQKEKEDNLISIAEPSHEMGQLVKPDRMLTIKAVHTNNVSIENIPANVNDAGKNSPNTLSLRNLVIQLFNQSTEKQRQITRLEDELRLYKKDKMLDETRIKLLESKIQKSQDNTLDRCKSCEMNKREIGILEGKIKKATDNEKQESEIKSSLQKEIAAYETLQRKHEKQNREMASKIKELETKNHQVMEVNKELEESLCGYKEHKCSIMEVSESTKTIHETANTEKSLDERFQKMSTKKNKVNLVKAAPQDRNDNKKRIQEKIDSSHDQATESTSDIAISERNKTNEIISSEWLNFNVNSKPKEGPVNREIPSTAEEVSDNTSILECFGCRKNGHIIKDCQVSLNMKVTLRDDEEEISKNGIRETFSRYGNISSVRIIQSKTNSAFVCFSKREDGETLLKDWKKDVDISERWKIEECRTRSVKCFKCGKKGHIEKYCQSSNMKQDSTKYSSMGNNRSSQPFGNPENIPENFFGITNQKVEKGGKTISNIAREASNIYPKESIHIPPNTPDNFFDPESQEERTFYPEQIQDLQKEMKEVKDLIYQILNQQQRQ